MKKISNFFVSAKVFHERKMSADVFRERKMSADLFRERWHERRSRFEKRALA